MGPGPGGDPGPAVDPGLAVDPGPVGQALDLSAAGTWVR